MNMQNVKLNGYSLTQRTVESLGIVGFGILAFISAVRYFDTFNTVEFLLAAMMGLIIADLVSGVVHWAADTWGSIATPIIGRTLIRSFREHHYDQMEITHHDFVETNGSSALLTVPILAALLLLPEGNGPLEFIGLTVFMFCIWIIATNQFHKWAHTQDPGWFVSILQAHKVIISKEVHELHHQNPNLESYCITTGWLNPLLNRTHFFRRLETLVLILTGIIPREEEIRRRHNIYAELEENLRRTLEDNTSLIVEPPFPSDFLLGAFSAPIKMVRTRGTQNYLQDVLDSIVTKKSA